MTWFNRNRLRRKTDKSIGAILIGTGLITRGELLKALRAKQEVDAQSRLGEILVKQKAITPSQLERALEVQRSLRGERIDYAAVTRDLIARATAELENLHGEFAELERIAAEIALTQRAASP